MATTESDRPTEAHRALRGQLVVGVLLSCLMGSGCNLVVNATRNACNEPCRLATEYKERISHCMLADRAWARIQKESPDISYSGHYAAGFKAGFTDYLWAGGSGSPPPLPPRRYWKFRYESLDGYQDIQDWFDGYRHGSAAAEHSGYRDTITVPTSLLQATNAEFGLGDQHALHENVSPLPMPRVVGEPSRPPAPPTPTQSKTP